MSTITQHDFLYVKKLVEERAAIMLEAGKEYLVASRLNTLAREEGFTSHVDLIADALDWFQRTEPQRAKALAKRVNEHERHLAQLLLERQPGALQLRRLELAGRGREKLELESALHKAIERNELVLYYQPKVNMRTGQIVGAEALLRWQHPEKGLLAPDHFLALFEQNGMQRDLGEYVMETALRQMESWLADDLQLTVSVNIDAMQLQKEDFSLRLSQLLDQQPQVPPRWLCLEILETNALDDIALVSDIMRRCQALGVRFALDDFGTGYSSLSYLKLLPLDLLKIDRSFVRDVLSDPNDAAIARTIVALGQSLGLSVVAEGVETEEQRAFLAANGCFTYQGYLFGAPMPIGEFDAFVIRTG